MVTQNIFVNIGKETNEAVKMKLLDSGRNLRISVRGMNIPSGSTARIYALKPDRTRVFNDCEVIHNDVLVHVTDQMLSVAGDVEAEVRIEHEGYIVTSFTFGIIVSDTLFDADALESTDEFNALDNALNEAWKLHQYTEEAKESADTAKESADYIKGKEAKLDAAIAEAGNLKGYMKSAQKSAEDAYSYLEEVRQKDSDIDSKIALINEETQQAVYYINGAKENALEDIDSEKTAAKNEVSALGDDYIENINNAYAGIEAKTDEQLARIPEVTQLAERVDNIGEVIDKTVEPLKKTVSDHERRIVNLEYASKGILYREEESEDVAYTKDVPSDAMPYGTLDSIGGKSIVMNQLVGDTYSEKTEGEAYSVDVENKAVSADVNKIGGKNIVWNQLAKLDILNGGSFENAQIIDGVKIGSTSVLNKILVYNNKAIPITKGHIFLFSVCTKSDSDKMKAIQINIGGTWVIERCKNDNVWHKYNIISTSIYDEIPSQYIRFGQYDSDSGIEASVSVKNIQIIDLTQMFGSGNEPTIEQFEAMFSNEYYPYSEPTIISADVDKVVSVGKNLFDNNRLVTELGWNVNGDVYYGSNTALHDAYKNGVPNLKFEPNTQYSISLDFKADDTSVTGVCRVYHTDETFVGKNFNSGDFTRFTIISSVGKTVDRIMFTYGSGKTTYYIKNIQLEKGSVATEYSPYREPIEITTPQAIRNLTGYGWSAGSVCNEVDFEKKQYVQRVGSVDLGSLSYYYWANRGDGVPLIVISPNLPTKANGISNLICEKYVSGNKHYGSMLDKEITGRAESGAIYFRDSVYTSASEFKSAMNGVMLYYELAEPIITDISDLLDSIEVEQGGTITFHQSDDAKHLPVPYSMTYALSEWSQQLDSTHKYCKNGELLQNVSSTDVVGGKDWIIDMTRANVDDVNAFPKSYYEKNDGEIVNADVESVDVVGKNLLDTNGLYIHDGYISVGKYSGSFNSTVVSFGTLIIPCEPNTSYTVTKAIGNRLDIMSVKNLYDREGTASISSTSALERHITTGSQDRWLYVWFYNASYDSEWSRQEILDTVQIEKGETATLYAPYKHTTIPLQSIISKYFPDGMKSAGSVSDVFDLENGVAVQNVGSVTFSNLNWSYVKATEKQGYYTNTGARLLFADMKKSVAQTSKINAVSNVEEHLTTQSGWTQKVPCWFEQYTSSIPNILFGLKNDDQRTDITKWLEYITGKTILYELATPITTPIDPQDLEALRILHVEAGGTITFAQDDLHIPVPNKESFLIKTGGAS